MKTTRTGALALLLAAVACAPAAAKPIPVDVRIEGVHATLFEGRVQADVHKVDSGDGTGAHKCDSTNGGAHPTPAPTLLGAFDLAVRRAGISWLGNFSADFEDFTIDRVGPDSSDNKRKRYWGQVLNFKDTQVGGCQQQLRPGDDVLVAFNSYGNPKLKLKGPRKVAAGQRFQVTVVDGQTGKPYEGATVRRNRTDANGHVPVMLPRAGTYRFKARAFGAVRSNALTVHAS
jgi:hypothetical protein